MAFHASAWVATIMYFYYLNFQFIWVINTTVLCRLSCSLRDIRCLDTTLTDSNCTSEWVPYTPGEFADASQQHSKAYTLSTLTDCQKACEFDPRCVAIDWQTSNRDCWITTDPRHTHYQNPLKINTTRHYHLVSRCNITAGQWFHNFLAFW